MDTLSLLFGSALRVKMMRLFLFNGSAAFDAETLCEKFGAKEKEALAEVAVFKKAGLVKQTKVQKIVRVVAKAKKGKEKKVVERTVTVPAWSLDPKFEFLPQLSMFLSKTHSLGSKAIVQRLEKAGKMKAILVSGIFTGDLESRFDIFVIGDGVKAPVLDRVVKGIEAEMGKEVRYVLLTSGDFAYRVGMNDKLVRDVLDFPHRAVLDRMGISKA